MDMKYLQLAAQTQAPTRASANNASPNPATAFEKKAKETADSFEAVFLSQILKNMSSGLKSDEMFGGGHSEEVFRGVLNDEIATQITRNGGIGLSDSIYREILKSQEVDPTDGQ